MSSTVYHRQTHRTSWESSPSHHKYSADYYEEPRRSGQPSKSILKTIRKSLCRIFGSRRLASHPNDSVDSLAYAGSDDSFEAESMDEDNMAWGRPPKRSKRRSWRRSRSGRDKEEDSIPRSPDSAQASCRLW